MTTTAKAKTKKRKLFAFNDQGGRFEFSSKDSLCDFLSITLRTLNRHLNDGTPIDGFFIDEELLLEDLM